MNDVEKRRKILLEQTRRLYYDDKMNPPIHPRYKAVYNQLYPKIEDCHRSSFGIRCILCIFVFIIYIMMGTNEQLFMGMDNMQVQQQIMQNITLELY